MQWFAIGYKKWPDVERWLEVKTGRVVIVYRIYEQHA